MRKSINVLIVCAIIQISFGQSNTKLFEEKIDAYLDPYLEMNAWSGIIMISKKGVPVFQKAYGEAIRDWQVPNRMDTKFRIASISKVFTEVAILKLVEDGKIKLEDKLSMYISDYPRGNEINIKHLLTHRSGIPHLNNFPNYNTLIKFSYQLHEVIDLFKNKPLDFNPDERYRYSNSGYVLLAHIIEKVSGKTYEQFLTDEIFTPHNLKNTGIDTNKKLLSNRAKGYMFDNNGKLVNADYVNMSIKIGGGSLYSTANDLNRFVKHLLNRQIINSTLHELPNFGEINGRQVFTANGRVQGFCHQITHRIAEDLTIIILGNHYSNIALPISDDIYKIYTKQEYKIPENYRTQKVQVPVAQLKNYEGTYDFGFGPIGVVKVVEDKLGYGTPGYDTYDFLIPLSNNRFFYIQSWVVLEFKKQEDKAYKILDWIMGDNVYSAERIDK